MNTISTMMWMLLAAPSLALATDRPKEVTTAPIEVRVQVDAQGHLSGITPMQPLKEPFAGIVQRTLAKWTFYPARVADRPVVTTTWLNVDLKALMREDGNAVVQVEYLGNGPYIEPLVAPAYPRDMARVDCEAEVDVQATVGANGHLANPRVVEAFTTRGQPAQDFVDAAFEAVKHTKAHAIIVDGQPVPTQVRIPITFNLGSMGRGHTGLERASDSAKFVHLDTASITPADFSGVALIVQDSPIKPLSTPGG